MDRQIWKVIVLLFVCMGLTGCLREGTMVTSTQAPPATVVVSATETFTPMTEPTSTPVPPPLTTTSTPAHSSATPTETPTLVPTPLPTNTPTPLPPTSTPTLAPPTPTPTTESGMTRIQFELGAISAVLDGHLADHGADRYILWAMAGQTMEVSVTAPELVSFSIWGVDGTILKRYVDEETEWQGVLPTTQDYYVKVVSIAETNYTLTVTIHPLPVEPERVLFEPGETAATVEGSLEPRSSDRYLLRALAGQSLYVSLSSWDRDVVVGIETGDGQVLARPEEGIHFAVVTSLPVTGDYALVVTSIGGSTTYTLKVMVPPPDEDFIPVFFEPGATSTTVEETLREGGDYASYVLRASQGQEMEVTLLTESWPIGIWVEGADGSTWKAPFGEHVLIALLPLTQDYVVVLLTSPQTAETPYTLTIRIPAP